MEPGSQYWERFGHNAVVISDITTGRSVAYNFGYFDFAQRGFMRNFLFGRMRYQAVAFDADYDLRAYASRGRRVWLQELELSAPQIALMRVELDRLVRPENAEYRYDYFRANCSTKVRDILELGFSGALKHATRGRSRGLTYRKLGLAHAAAVPWMYAGIHAGLGPNTDQVIGLYEELFIPARLREALAELRVSGPDGSLQPAVRNEQILGGPAAYAVPIAPDWRWHFTLTGLALGGLLGLGLRSSERRTLRWLGASSALFALLTMGLGGVLLSFFWLFSEHSDAYRNLNLSLFNPLCLLLMPSAFGLFRRDFRPARTQIRLLQLVLAIGVFGAFIKVFPAMRQQNIEWVLLWLPVQWALLLSIASPARRRSVQPQLRVGEVNRIVQAGR